MVIARRRSSWPQPASHGQPPAKARPNPRYLGQPTYNLVNLALLGPGRVVLGVSRWPAKLQADLSRFGRGQGVATIRVVV
ncbi:unnamed protein product [Victoria cruziana]